MSINDVVEEKDFAALELAHNAKKTTNKVREREKDRERRNRFRNEIVQKEIAEGRKRLREQIEGVSDDIIWN